MLCCAMPTKLFLLLILCLTPPLAIGDQTRHFPPGVQNIFIPQVVDVQNNLLQNIAPIAEKSIGDGYYPGAVILAAHHGHIIYRGVFGNRRILPNIAPMRFNTLFDLASLTKVIATAPAVMQLVEQGKLDLDAPVVKYWPAFGINGKEAITIRELLTHTSGLPADISTKTNTNEIFQQIAQLKPLDVPGKTFRYSDVNFIVLAHLVEMISGRRLDDYAQKYIFKPLAMDDTRFLPSAGLRDRIAPTEIIDGELRWGQVHDPTAHAMGGVAGNAGLFSDAADLGKYAECMLHAGRITITSPHNKKHSAYLLSPLTILKMTTPQTPPDVVEKRGLGWDIDSPYANHGALFPINSYGHTGWTGTSIWIDPVTQTWLIILTSRTHPTPAVKNQLIEDRRLIANIVAASVTDIDMYKQQNIIQPGATQLNNYLPLLQNKRVGIFANHSSLLGNTPLIDVLLQHGIRVTKIFAPEHGFRTDMSDGDQISNTVDLKTGIPIISLYGKKLKPTASDLQDVDILVFDIQDVGVRFYTYISSLQKFMEAAVENNKPLIILDRPNPNGFYVDGPVLDPKFKSFTGMQPVPIVYGMTIGEYAKMLLGEQWLNVTPKAKANDLQLTVIPCVNYTHKSLYEPPVSPSPSLPNVQSIYWYPAIGLMEATAMSVGRGTDEPFQVFGHPLLPTKFTFVPTAKPGNKHPAFENQVCHGWNLMETKTATLQKINGKLQIKYLISAYQLFPNKDKFFKGFGYAAGNDTLEKQIKAGVDEATIRKSWEPALNKFKQIRKKYLLYPDFE
jgi:uncharacterized protein YbbC (DUF1343 family)/CubicO group peptidase (beta-lactamase class C family)